MSDSKTRVYAPPGDLVRLTSDEPLVFELADRLWEPASAGTPGHAGAAIEIEIRRGEDEDFLEGAGRVDAQAPAPPRGEGAADPSCSFEESQRWTHEAQEFRCAVPGALLVTIDFAAARVAARIAPFLFLLRSRNSSSLSTSISSSFSSFLARTLLEAPAAVLLGRRGWQVLHAGAVVGPRGAAVVRGPSGTGKSTLVAAAHGDGLGVLGDESLFVSRTDSDALAASVRDLALREDSARLLGIFEATEPAYTGRERKCRVDLFNGSSPRDRVSRRVATVLLGPREPGPARLSPLSGLEFAETFRAGAIPQERAPGDADAVGQAWATGRSFLLSGASDLAGATALLRSLVV